MDSALKFWFAKIVVDVGIVAGVFVAILAISILRLVYISVRNSLGGR